MSLITLIGVSVPFNRLASEPTGTFMAFQMSKQDKMFNIWYSYNHVDAGHVYS